MRTDQVGLALRALAVVAVLVTLAGCSGPADGPRKISAASLAPEPAWTPATAGPLAAAGPLRAHLENGGRVVCDDASYGEGVIAGTGVMVSHRGSEKLIVRVTSSSGSDERRFEPSPAIALIDFDIPLESVQKVILIIDSDRHAGVCEVPRER